MKARPPLLVDSFLTCAAILGIAWLSSWGHLWAGEAAQFTPLLPIAAPKIVAAAEAFDGRFAAENILKPPASHGRHPEYASRGLGTKTFIEFDFGREVSVGAYRHVQRGGPDTIAEADLVFGDSPDFRKVLATVKVRHTDEPGATTFASFAPIKTRYVRWQVTSVLAQRSKNVGGQSIEWFGAGVPEALPHGIRLAARVLPIMEQAAGGATQLLKITLTSPYAESLASTVRVSGQAPRAVPVEMGSQTLQYMVPARDVEAPLEIAVDVQGKTVASHSIIIPAARRLTVYVLPHSHTDIGYTAIQTDIEEKQVNNLLQGLADARRTADYPEGARFVWNVEVAWAADLFLKRLPAKHREDFLEAVRKGQIALHGMYLNELTGLCRPEELIRLFRYATLLGQRTGVPIDSAMMSDVPGYTWGTVTAMNQAGIRYFPPPPTRRRGSAASASSGRTSRSGGLAQMERAACWCGFRSADTRCRCTIARCRCNWSRRCAKTFRIADIRTTSPTCVGLAMATTPCLNRRFATSSSSGTRPMFHHGW